MKFIKIKLAALLLSFSFLISCNAIKTAAYDQYSYQKAVEIKVDASKLMEKSVNPYADYSDAVDELLTDIEKIIVYEENKPNNGISLKMWNLLADNEKNLLAGYMKKWQEDEELSRIFVNEAKPEIEKAINLIIEYEGKKDKESKSNLLDMILGN